ncbi:hypothetical protein NW765_003675 [Fusarium oxysporum]|nr:hypothetical protein NW765_003675 [Fusarium oxysporum]
MQTTAFPPTGCFRFPGNAKDHRYQSREHLLRAQWAIDQLEMALHASNLTTANPQRGLMVKNELESWTVEYDGLINEHQCKEDDANDLQAEMLSAVEVEDPCNNRLSPERKLLELLPHPGDLGETKYRHRIYRILGATSVQDLIHLMDIAIYEQDDYCYRIQLTLWNT